VFSDRGCSSDDLAQPVSFPSVKVSLDCQLFDLQLHIFPALFEILKLLGVLFLDRFSLPAMASRGLCVPLSLLVCLLRCLRVIYVDWNWSVAARKRYECLLAITRNYLRP
jgi:hypothetical protein